MPSKCILLAAAAAFAAVLTPSDVGAYGAAHVGYTHVGPNGAYHVGETAVARPGVDSRGGYAGGAEYRGGYVGGAEYRGAAYGTAGATRVYAPAYGGAAYGGTARYDYVR
jgi:hypothetical protein